MTYLPTMMNFHFRCFVHPWTAVLLGVAACSLGGCGPRAKDAPATPEAAAIAIEPVAALSVDTVQPRSTVLPISLAANGNISAWQEASIGSQSNGLPLKEVLVNVGDQVQRGQVLAVFDGATVEAELAQLQAGLAEAEATFADAAANATRARTLESSGALSAQQISQYLTSERTSQARVMVQRAALAAQQLRLQHTKVRASDSGVISARQATVGSVVPTGQELFRLIRQGRLEWRAEVGDSDVDRVHPGTPVLLRVGGRSLPGTVRQVAPVVEQATRNALVYVDLPDTGVKESGVKAGMFGRGEFDLGRSAGLTLPQTAVTLRDGFSTVMTVGANGKLTQHRVNIGRRMGEQVEITAGLTADMRVVASGGAFLADGDAVRVVESVEHAPAAASTPASSPGLSTRSSLPP